jgi:glycosyltransferase involved in cell wall biosynthesis
MVTFSTLIPVYNGKEYIASAIDSALGQKDVSVEVIVIDDGSTDETPEILRSYGDSIRVLRQKNGGHVNARNNGSELAKGEWLAFLDADDEWLPEKLARQLARADTETAVIYTDRWNFGTIDRVAERQSDGVTLLEGDVFEDLLMGNFITVSSVIIRKDVFEQLGKFDEDMKVCEDWDLWLRYSGGGGKIGLCPEPLMRFRWHPTSMSTNQERMCHGRMKVLEKALASPRGQKVPAALARRGYANVWKCSAWHAAHSDWKTALRWYGRAALAWPWDWSVYKEMAKCCLGR